MVRVYGIANCDRMKKARHWLDAHGVAYAFHDYKKAGVDEALLRAWVAELGWEALVNRMGSTWRKLPPEMREAMDDEAAIRVMLASPSLIRRPLLDNGGARYLGFSPEQYQEVFG